MNIEIDAFVQSVISRSATFEERIISYLEGGEFRETDESQNRLNRWEQRVSPVNGAAPHCWIAALGLSQAELRKVLGSHVPRSSGTRSNWAVLLRSILEGSLDPDGCEEAADHFAGRLTTKVPTEFVKLYWPVVRCAKRQLKELVGNVYPQLTDDAHAALEAHLLNRLLEAGRHVLRLQFAIFKTVAQSSFADDSSFPRRESTLSVNHFVGRVPGERLLRLFEEYPVHARHCATLGLNWINTTQRLLTRLAGDLPELSKRFNAGLSLGFVIGLQTGLSDPHHGGETVTCFEFAGSQRIVYKPRSLAAEGWFSEILSWVSNSHSSRQFKSPSVWDRNDYGWAEFISVSSCHDLAAIRRFYWRAGALLGLVHLCRGVDCHRGNLIAHGEHPVLIDVDALWHLQNPAQPSQAQRANFMERSLHGSVLRTGFLPGGNLFENVEYSQNALNTGWSSTPAGQITKRSDGVVTSVGMTHLPTLGDSFVSATCHVSAIMAGFRWFGRTVLGSAEHRTQFSTWLEKLQHCSRRRIYRSTQQYSNILQQSLDPSLLKEGVDFDLSLAALFAGQFGADVTAEELTSLEHLDIPHFSQAPLGVIPVGAASLPTMEDYLNQLTLIRRSLQSDLPGYQGIDVQKRL